MTLCRMRTWSKKEYCSVFLALVLIGCVLLYVIDTSASKITESVVRSRHNGKKLRISAGVGDRPDAYRAPKELLGWPSDEDIQARVSDLDDPEQSGDSSSGSGFGSGDSDSDSGSVEAPSGSTGVGVRDPGVVKAGSGVSGSAAKESGEDLPDESVPDWLSVLLESGDVANGDDVMGSKGDSVQGNMAGKESHKKVQSETDMRKGENSIVNAKGKMLRPKGEIPAAKGNKGAEPAIPKDNPRKPPSKGQVDTLSGPPGQQPAQRVQAPGRQATPQGNQQAARDSKKKEWQVNAGRHQSSPDMTVGSPGLSGAEPPGQQPGEGLDTGRGGGVPECSAVRAQYLAARCVESPDLSDVMKRLADSGQHYPLMLRAQRKMRSETRLLVSDVRRVILCASAKCASTSLKALMALSAGGVQPGEKVLSHNKTYLNQHDLYFISDYYPRQAAKRLKTYTKFITVRHPFDRLLSAYEDKVASSREPFTHYFASANGTKLSFQRFLAKLVAQYPRTPFSINAHWFPYSPACDPCHVMYDHVLRLETFEEDLPFIQRHLPNAGVNDTQGVPRRNLSAKRPADKLAQVTERFRQIKPETIKGLLEIYRYDFELFGYGWDDQVGASYGIHNATHLASPTEENQRIC